MTNGSGSGRHRKHVDPDPVQDADPQTKVGKGGKINKNTEPQH